MKSYGRHFLLDRRLKGGHARNVMGAMLERVEAVARASALPIAFPNMTPDEKLLMELLAGKGYLLVRDLPISVLDIRWGDFDEYLSFLGCRSKKIRRNIKTEINRTRRMGVSIRPIENPGASLPAAFTTCWRRTAGAITASPSCTTGDFSTP